MKRFITYLYECEKGNKLRNVGFARVDVRSNQMNVEISIRNFSRSNEVGKIYLLVGDKELLGVDVAEIKVIGGQGQTRFVCDTENLCDKKYMDENIVGIAIKFKNNGYVESCWADEWAEAIVNEQFYLYSKLQEDEEVTPQIEMKEEQSEIEEVLEEMELQLVEAPRIKNDEKENNITYHKIDLSQIRTLPSKNWHLSNNSFLIHGFLNYGYLILKEEMEGDKKKLALGVPGLFEKPEMVMAIMFGFPEFVAVPEAVKELPMGEMVNSSNKEKNQEPKTREFGCWFVNL